MLFAIAWKNVWRNKLRSLIVVLSIVVGLMGGLFYLAFSNGMVQNQIGSSIQTEISNIQFHNPKFLVNNEIKYTIPDPEEKINRLKSLGTVKASSSRIKSMVMISSAATGTGLSLNGIDFEREREVTDIHSKITRGDYFETKIRNPILIGEKLAKKLKVKVKSKVVITTQDVNDNIVYGSFRVVGIYRTHNTMFDLTNAFVLKDDMTDLIQLDKSTTSEIAVLLTHNDFTEKTAGELKTIFKDEIENDQVIIRSWKEINPILKMLNDMTLQFTLIFVIIILVALSFGIINTMLMAIMERVREIGMLMAIGMNKIKVFLMIMLETVFLSMTGGIIGLILSWIAVAITNTTGIDLSSVAEGLNAIGYSSFIRPELGIFFYFLIGTMVIMTAIFASIFPARKALKLKPAEAIRQDV
jgi:ABC-type lipoprotein release transport system permease subunit